MGNGILLVLQNWNGEYAEGNPWFSCTPSTWTTVHTHTDQKGRSLQTSWSPTKTWIHLIGHSVPCYWQHSVCFIFAADELYGSLSPNHSGGGLQAVHN